MTKLRAEIDFPTETNGFYVAIAHAMMKNFGADAEILALEAGEKLEAAQDPEGSAIWRTIYYAIRDLRGLPSGAIH